MYVLPNLGFSRQCLRTGVGAKWSGVLVLDALFYVSVSPNAVAD